MKRERVALLLVIAAAGCMAAALALPLLHSGVTLELPAWVPAGFRSRFRRECPGRGYKIGTSPRRCTRR
jgi:hypothetical protein